MVLVVVVVRVGLTFSWEAVSFAVVLGRVELLLCCFETSGGSTKGFDCESKEALGGTGAGFECNSKCVGAISLACLKKTR